VELTDTENYVLANAAEAGGCWLWELGAAAETQLEDRVLHWHGVDPSAAQAAAIDLCRKGFAIVTGEHVDERQHYTGESWVVEESDAVASLSDLANWAEPLAAPPRAAVYRLAATSAGETALAAADGLEPDEVRVKPGA